MYSDGAGKYLTLVSNAAGCSLSSIGAVALSVVSGQAMYLRTASGQGMFLSSANYSFRDTSNVVKGYFNTADGNLSIIGAFGLRATANSLADNDWQMVISGADLLIQKRVGGAWVTKGTFGG